MSSASQGSPQPLATRRPVPQAALLDAVRRLTSELDLEALPPRLAEAVTTLVGADGADCWLFDERRVLLRRSAGHGLDGEALPRVVRPHGVLANATSGAVVTRGFQAENGWADERYAGVVEAVAAPIAAGDDVRGVLVAYARDTGRFGDEEVEVLEAFAGLGALALRNADAFAERSRQARLERTASVVSARLARPLTLRDTYGALAEAAAEAFAANAAAVLVPGHAALEPAGGHALSESLARALAGDAVAGEHTLAAAAAQGQTVAAPALAADERFGEAWRDVLAAAGVRALLAVPFEVAREHERGLLVVFFATPRAFADDDVELARHVADAASSALERSALYEQERRARSLAQQLARTGSLLATELDPDAVLEEVVRQAPALLAVEACAMRVVEGDELVVSAVEGDALASLLGGRSPAAGWLSGDVVQSRSPLAVEDASGDERLLAVDEVLARGYAAYLGVPVTGAERLDGVLAVYSRRPRAWRAEEVEALLALAANASAALANAELYQRVALEKERSSAILANVADGIVAVDRHGCVVLWNEAAEEITGVPSEEARTRTLMQVLGRNLESTAESPRGERLVPILRGGEEVWLSLTEAVMRDPAGAVAGRIYAFRDISSERLVEEMKSSFVTTVSQQLRRPLTSIYGFAETLLRRDVLFGAEERTTFLRYIASESERLTAIVDTLLNVARLDTGDLQVTLVPTDVAAVVSEVVSATEETRSLDGHRLVMDVAPEPLVASADADKLKQVLSNLIDNGIKFSPGGGKVTVAARRARDAIELSVSDEGIGIPPAEQQRIFSKFYRRNTRSAAAESAGTGLGLFIVQGLVSAMGGRIWVESAEGQGSRFAFELPLADPVTAETLNEAEKERV